jgi:hypothetical protein
MFKKLLQNIRIKTFVQIEKEENVTKDVDDLPSQYLGLPPSKRFYREGEIDFEKTRKKFNRAARRLGINVVE